MFNIIESKLSNNNIHVIGEQDETKENKIHNI